MHILQLHLVDSLLTKHCIFIGKFNTIYCLFSWLHREQSNYCPGVMEKIWQTVAQGQRPGLTPFCVILRETCLQLFV